jgi:hypothetical protein
MKKMSRRNAISASDEDGMDAETFVLFVKVPILDP